MAFNLIQEIRKRSREEWANLPKERLVQARIWIQENPEKAFAVGIAAGVVVIMAFSLVMTILFLAAVCFGIVYAIALPSGSDGTTSPSDTKKYEDEEKKQ